MTFHNQDIIYPCPFSKSYGIPAQQAWSLLNVFLIYRLALTGIFALMFYKHYVPALSHEFQKQLYLSASAIYFVISILSIICVFWRLTRYTTQAQVLIFSDIFIITLLIHACGGLNSGLGMLLAVSVAAGGLLIGGRCSLVFAAIASLSILAEQIYVFRSNDFEMESMTHAGMLGAAYFTIAYLSHILTKRSEQVAQLANRQEKTIANLEELNQYIIQHLQAGIIIINRSEMIQTANEAALRLANLNWIPTQLGDISTHLSRAFQTWLTSSQHDFLLLQRPGQNDLPVRFTLLPAKHEFFYMVMLEDITLYNQRLQQSKLASLGRLTASIAHEIRNPLGAISHAGQLLSENPELSAQDQRLTGIITHQSQRVNTIINDILQLSRRQKSRRETLLLKPWLENYLQHFLSDHRLANDAVFIQQDENDLTALADPNHLKQILDNLCLNALKYGCPGRGSIVLHVFRWQQAPCIDVIDHGAGISPEHIEQLFEPFFTTASDGTGLGLFISKELAELNQAKLSYYSNHKPYCFRLHLMDAHQTLIEI